MAVQEDLMLMPGIINNKNASYCTLMQLRKMLQKRCFSVPDLKVFRCFILKRHIDELVNLKQHTSMSTFFQ